MKVALYSSPFFMDSDLPYLSAQKNNIEDLYYIIDIAPFSLKSTILNIEHQHPYPGIFNASIYKELDTFRDFINLDKLYVVNRTNQKGFALTNIILNFKLFLLLIKLKLDILQITSWFDYSKLHLYFFRKKTIVVTHDPLPHTGESILDHIYRFIALKLCRNFLLFNSNQKKEFIETYNLVSKNVFTTRFGVFNYMNCFISVNKFKISETPFILYFGRISPYKGIEFLLEAMKVVHEKHPNIKLIVAGSGKFYFDKTEFENLSYIDIQNRFIPIEELAHLINNCLFTICPYTDATQSGVISSSYGLCKTVVATNVGGLGEMIINNETGFLVEPRNIDQLSSVINLLLSHPSLRIRMEKNIESRYFKGAESWQSIADEIMSYYQMMLKKN
jgi:glycosyltransferase involved in cell wall biosynthesis